MVYVTHDQVEAMTLADKVNLLQELNDIELHRESIIKQMETYQESYTKEDLFDKIIHDALNK